MSEIFPYVMFSRTLKSTYIIGVAQSEFSGSQKRADKGGGEEGKSVSVGTRPERERGGKNEGNRMCGKGPESMLEKLRFWHPVS